MEERRKINRVKYPSNTVIVVCDTQEKIYCRTENVSPLGMGIRLPAGAPKIEGMDVIVVAETLIMYADVLREDPQDDGTTMIGVQARKFTPEVLQYLFDHVGD
ncbi:MAG: PilZ domain-containing protein [Lachnospiraceae bacterium]|nr:PilZ domain-containing protein [Lachnospiraceae bacterium]